MPRWDGSSLSSNLFCVVGGHVTESNFSSSVPVGRFEKANAPLEDMAQASAPIFLVWLELHVTPHYCSLESVSTWSKWVIYLFIYLFQKLFGSYKFEIINFFMICYDIVIFLWNFVWIFLRLFSDENNPRVEYTPIVHSPAINLGQRQQRTHVGQKNSCSQWGEAVCTQEGAQAFLGLAYQARILRLDPL
jgi:hypothetical protein